MKKKFYLAFSICILFFSHYSFTQTGWYQPLRLTNGYVDRYPAFKSINNTGYQLNILKDFEFFVFVRYTQPYSQICLAKIGNNGLTENVLYLTSGNYLRQNPCISYGNNYIFDVINSSLVLWETNENGRWDIYGKYYKRQSGWGVQFAFDNSTVNKNSPQCVCIDSSKYAVVYVKSGDIIFRTYNPITQTVTYETNLTASDTASCFNPHVAVLINYPTSYYMVTYEKRKPDSKRAIYYSKSTGLTSWSAPDTAAFLGDNYFNSFSAMATYIYPFGISFTTDRTGYKDIYATAVPMPSGTPVQEKVFTNSGFNFYNFTSVNYPIITDYVYMHASAHLKRINDSIKVMLDYRGQTMTLLKDSTTICDTSKLTSVTLSSGFNTATSLWGWVIYSKDSANVSQLWGRKKIINLGGVNKIGNSVPDEYSLSQNYPNPFNPTTTIRFSIPSLSFQHVLSWNPVKLIVYDILGREVQTLVNEKLKPGEYEVSFDGNSLSSGIYFYTLFAEGNLIDTKKLVLLK